MSSPDTRTDVPVQPTPAPDGVRDALAELVQLGLSVARLVARIAEAETAAVAQAAMTDLDLPVPDSYAEAIEADRLALAMAEVRKSSVARAEMVTEAFTRAARSVRLTVLLVERLDRGWARRTAPDDRATMARRQVACGVADVIAREADGERAVSLREALGERLERLDVERELEGLPVDEVIAGICRDLGLDPVRMVVRPPVRDATGFTEGGPLPGDMRWEGRTPLWRPDG